jgi:hypothetical protein
MVNHFFSDFFDRFEPSHAVDREESRATWLMQQLSHASAQSGGDWDPAQLDAACRAVAAGPNGSIPRIHLVLPCPPGARGAFPVAERARSLAKEYGVRAQCTLRNGTITVVFERLEAHP